MALSSATGSGAVVTVYARYSPRRSCQDRTRVPRLCPRAHPLPAKLPWVILETWVAFLQACDLDGARCPALPDGLCLLLAWGTRRKDIFDKQLSTLPLAD